jgi:hypothetical protein
MSEIDGGCLCGAIRYRVTGKPTNTMVCGDGLPAFPQSRPH